MSEIKFYRHYRVVLVLIAIAFLAALPFLVSGYRSFQFTLVISYAVSLLGLNILTGYSGQISLGHGAFYAIGAYVTAIILQRTGIPYWGAIPIAGIACFVIGFLFGIPALRLEGLFLALATFALAIALPQLLKFRAVQEWTGGVQGLTVMKPETPSGLPLSEDQWLYLFALMIAILLFLVGRNLVVGRIGRALVAIRDNPIAASSMGIHKAWYKSVTFGISALYTGIGGAIGAIATQFISPDSFSFLLSVSFLVGVVIGGLSSISGAIYGALFIQFVPNYAEAISKSAPWTIYGLLLIAFMYIAPSGIAGALRSISEFLRRPTSTTEDRTHAKHDR